MLSSRQPAVEEEAKVQQHPVSNPYIVLALALCIQLSPSYLPALTFDTPHMSFVNNVDKRELQGDKSNKSTPSDDIDSLTDVGRGLPLRDRRRGGKAMISTFPSLRCCIQLTIILCIQRKFLRCTSLIAAALFCLFCAVFCMPHV